EAQRVDIEVTDGPRLQRERRIMTIEPVHAPMRFQVGVVQYPPDRRAAHRPARGVVVECSCDIVEAPPRGWAVIGGEFTGSDRHNVDLFSGGKSAAAGLSAAHLGAQLAPAPDIVSARGQRYV